MELTGTSEIIDQAVQVVARKNLSIACADLRKNAALQDANGRMRKGKERTQRPCENEKVQASGEVLVAAKVEKKDEMLSPAKRTAWHE